MGHARKRGARELFALTTTIEPLLARRGFTRIDRSEVPAAVRQSADAITNAVVLGLILLGLALAVNWLFTWVQQRPRG